MSEPSPEYGPDFWVKACGGKYLVTAKIGVHWTLAELIYDKYCRPGKVPREHLYYVLAWLKQAPSYRCMQTICPCNVQRQPSPSTLRRIVESTLEYLFGVMVEISADHLDHPNNSCPHFPDTDGGWDTFPIFVLSGAHLYQPKYKHSVVKFNAIVTHLGLCAYISGPHPGAMSDTTIARKYRPGLSATHTLLGDLAYLSVPNCLTPFKCPPNGSLTHLEDEFNGVQGGGRGGGFQSLPATQPRLGAAPVHLSSPNN